VLDAAARLANSGVGLTATARTHMLHTAAAVVRQLPGMASAVNTSTALLEVLSAALACTKERQVPTPAEALAAHTQAVTVAAAVGRMLSAAAIPGHGLIASGVCVSVAAVKRPIAQLDSFQLPVGPETDVGTALDIVRMTQPRRARVLQQADGSETDGTETIGTGDYSITDGDVATDDAAAEPPPPPPAANASVVLPSYLSSSCGAADGASCPVAITLQATYYSSAALFTEVFPSQLLPTMAVTNITAVTGVLEFFVPDWPAADVGVCDSTEAAAGECDMHVLLPAAEYVAARPTACMRFEEGALKGFPQQPGMGFVGECGGGWPAAAVGAAAECWLQLLCAAGVHGSRCLVCMEAGA
jgi:hypothetical protein